MALKSLPTAKCAFPMTYWKREDVIIPLGGYDSSHCFNEVQQYSRLKNCWRALLCLPEKIWGSSAIVMSDVLYNLGGHNSTKSVYWLDLVSEKRSWNSLKTLRPDETVFNQFYRDASVVKNTIVNFRSYPENETYVLKQEEGFKNIELISKFTGMTTSEGTGIPLSVLTKIRCTSSLLIISQRSGVWMQRQSSPHSSFHSELNLIMI